MSAMSRWKFSLVILPLLFVPVANGAAPKGVTAVRSGALTVYVSDNAEITEVKMSDRRLTRAVSGSTVLDGCTVQGPVTKKDLAGGGVSSSANGFRVRPSTRSN